MHNVTEYPANSSSDLNTKHFDVQPDGDTQTGLVVFHQEDSTFGPYITVNSELQPGRHVRIEGEDLYAFRELLNELPESAFVRPADPVLETYCFKDNDGDWFYWDDEADGWRWVFFAPSSIFGASSEIYGSLDSVAEMSYIDGEPTPKPEPFWRTGDILVYQSEHFMSVYERKDDGWYRISGSHSRHKIGKVDRDDAVHQRRLENFPDRYTAIRAR